MQTTWQHREQLWNEHSKIFELLSTRIPNFQCQLPNTHLPHHLNGAFASSLPHIHLDSALVSPRHYCECDLQCIAGYTRSCTVTNAVSTMHWPFKICRNIPRPPFLLHFDSNQRLWCFCLQLTLWSRLPNFQSIISRASNQWLYIQKSNVYWHDDDSGLWENITYTSKVVR